MWRSLLRNLQTFRESGQRARQIYDAPRVRDLVQLFETILAEISPRANFVLGLLGSSTTGDTDFLGINTY